MQWRPIGIAILLLAFCRLTAFLVVPSSDKQEDLNIFLTIYSLSIAGLLLFIVHYLLTLFLDRTLAWKKFPISRFLSQMVLGTTLSLFCLNIIYQSVKHQFTEAPPDTNQVILMNIYGVAIILPIIAFYFGFKFLQAWRKSELESEQLMKENTRTQLLTLRNHLDPHFLFNNLNILSTLMEKNMTTSKTYLDKFAEVYRQILKKEHSDLTSLEEELKLIDSYMYLLKIRFENQVEFEINISATSNDKAIPPLTLQMLIENAIKHNMASEESPIHILIYDEGDYLIVKNNVQKKKYAEKEREGTGINNIKKRYSFFTDLDVEVREEKGHFIVMAPLLEIEYD